MDPEIHFSSISQEEVVWICLKNNDTIIKEHCRHSKVFLYLLSAAQIKEG